VTNTKLLEKKIEESGLRKNFIARALNLSPYGFAKKINNETEFKTSEVDKLCKILGITTLTEKDRIFFAN
jgi:hypothetical protein